MTKHLPLPPAEKLWELFDYKPLTGELIWKVRSKKIRIGQVAGTTNANGYRSIRIDGIPYQAHRLVWMWVKSEEPAELTIDHRNFDPSDNRIENLRKATQIEQSRYRRNAVGAYLISSGKYEARITINGRKEYLGCYTSFEEATTVYHKKAQEIHGEFYCAPDVDVA